MKGRKPKPTELRLLNGNAGKRPINMEEPKPTKGVPDPLATLTPAGRAHFDRLSKQLSAVNVLTVIDGVALSGLAQSVADYEQATAELSRMGKVIITERGAVKNPWTTLQKQAFDQMQKGFADFGLTPSARTRIKADPVGDDEDEERFFGSA